jgi:subtilisin family serine protease
MNGENKITSEENKITSEENADFIVDYRNKPRLLQLFDNSYIHTLNDTYAVAYTPLTSISTNMITEYNYSTIPKVYGLVSEAGFEASGANRLQKLSNFNLTGKGVLIAIIDTGIDYLNPVFRNADGSTRIAAIWDQSIQSDSEPPFNTGFGTEYRAEQINQALASENPLDLVPSIDTNGHGTMMAGVAAGTENQEVGFQSIAPEAEFVIVKLQQAKKYLRDFFFIPEGVVCYQENHIMWGVQYCLRVARQLERPLVLCLGIGSSQNSHVGRSHLSNYLSKTGDFSNVGIVVAAGNEGNRGRHFYGTIVPNSESTSVDLLIGDAGASFSMELWGQIPGLYSIDILSPNGEYVSRIAIGFKVSRQISFQFDNTIIYIDYQLTESLTGDQLILIRFRNATPGTWKFTVYSESDLSLGFHIWLPMGDFISNNIYFIQPNIYTTVLTPGSAFVPITVTAYNPINETLYVNASRGYTTGKLIKPEIAAPGVNYLAPALNGEFTTYTGTSVSAAHTAGAVALFLEWAVVLGNDANIDTLVIKNYLIRGARRKNIVYPNRDWGYGILDIYNVFTILRRTH